MGEIIRPHLSQHVGQTLGLLLPDDRLAAASDRGD